MVLGRGKGRGRGRQVVTAHDWEIIKLQRNVSTCHLELLKNIFVGYSCSKKEDNLAHMKQTRSPWWSLIKTCWHSSEHISLIASKQVSPNSNRTFGLLWATMNMCAFAQIMCTHGLNIANLWQRLRNNVQFAFTATTTTVTNELNNGNNDSWFQCSYLVSTIWENRGKTRAIQVKWFN